MGFFEQQDRARRATARLALLYGLAVAAIVVAADAVCALVYSLSYWEAPDWRLYAGVSVATLVVIALGTVEIIARLSVGEGELALLLAGRRVPRGAAFEGERRLINVVDELAIASGLAAPPIYVLTRERGINAFAVGRSPNQAIIVVTQGALDKLSRDELQGVVAHEFGHILNGDVLINLRAACVLQGIVFLSAIGRFMMQVYSGYGTEEGRRLFHLPFAAVGAGLFGIGALGVPFARWIQGAISREREYLADACAVQFTRNGDALCGALARIHEDAVGDAIANWHAEAMAHMLFSAGSHPPIEERMRRINPHLPPEYFFERAHQLPSAEPARRAAAPVQPSRTIAPTKATAVAILVATLGEPTPRALEHAAGLLAYLPGPLREALADPLGAQAAMFACLLEGDAALRALRESCGESMARRAEVLAPLIAELDRAYRLPLVALALPVLRKEIDAAARERFLAALRALIHADQRVTLAEFVFATILEANLGPEARRAGPGNRTRGELAKECALLLALLADAGMEPPPAGIEDVSAALRRLRQLAPAEKAAFLAACAEVVTDDGNVKLFEHELLRAVCSALDCPMPPAMAALDERLLVK